MSGLGPCPCDPCGGHHLTSPPSGHLTGPAQRSPAPAAGLKLVGWQCYHLVWVAAGAGPPVNCPALAQISEDLSVVVVGAGQSPGAGWRCPALGQLWEWG